MAAIAIFPKLTVNNYPEMLRKISGSTFLFSVVCVILLRHYIPEIKTALDQWLSLVNFTIYDAHIPLGVMIPGLLMAILSEMWKLHDKLGRLFSVRKIFDVHHILILMCIQVNVSVNRSKLKTMWENSRQLMYDCFYTYASGTPGKALIDSHAITMALTNWSWYWCLTEGTFVLIVSMMFAVAFGAYGLAVGLLIAALLALAMMRLIFIEAIQYAEIQIDEILKDGARKTVIKARFHAL